ncbi:MAG: biofilm PGA synthesis protein PgaB [Bacteroidales bacterium]|nr:MAG: biofilm PGA synthesis protein PgaB [Bacteroidales bacterium]
MKKKYQLLVMIFLILTACGKQQPDDNKIVVGVFIGNGAGAISVVETIEALKIDKDISPLQISASDIQSGKLDDIDAIIFPGGSGSKQLNNLGDYGKEKIRKFVTDQGKGIVGICAGAFLTSSTPGYPSLELGNVKVIDRAHYARGRGLVEFKLSGEGKIIFPELDQNKLFCQYYDGPVMECLVQKETYSELATYVTDIHPNAGAPKEVTPGKIFLYKQKVGKGRLFAIAGHPESTPGMRWMVPRMIRWVTNNKQVKYNAQLIKPENYTHEILYDKNLKINEKANWWGLFNASPDSVIISMNYLHSICSRPAVRWNIGLLRNPSLKVRLHAAELLKNSEYTAALPDLIVAFEKEKDQDVKIQLSKIIDDFRAQTNGKND